MTELFTAAIGSENGPILDELFALCAEKFNRVDNPWRMSASKLRQKGAADPSSWKFKDLDTAQRAHQMRCLTAVLHYTNKNVSPANAAKCDAVVALMLSQMLMETPQWIPA